MYTSKHEDDEETGAINPATVKFSYICGTIKNEDELRFKKMVFRLSRGNILALVLNPDFLDKDSNKQMDSLYDDNGNKCQKKVFFLAFQLGKDQI